MDGVESGKAVSDFASPIAVCEADIIFDLALAELKKKRVTRTAHQLGIREELKDGSV